MNSRKIALARLEKYAAERHWEGCSESCFKILYGLPAEVQFNSAVFMLNRCLPIIGARKPKAVSTKVLLDAPAQWFAKKGLNVPSLGGREGPAEAAFITALYFLLCGYKAKDVHLGLTTACASSVVEAVKARMCNVWEADDPEAVRDWESLSKEESPELIEGALRRLNGRTVIDNAASSAVGEREWKVFAKQLSSEAVQSYRPRPRAEVEQAFNRWRDQEMLPISR